MARYKSPDHFGQEYMTKSGYLGWIDRMPWGAVSLELSFYSSAQLARENTSKLIDSAIGKYLGGKHGH